MLRERLLPSEQQIRQPERQLRDKGNKKQHDDVSHQEGKNRFYHRGKRCPGDVGADEKAYTDRWGSQADHQVQHGKCGEMNRVNADFRGYSKERWEKDDQRRNRLHEHADDQQQNVDQDDDHVPPAVRQR